MMEINARSLCTHSTKPLLIIATIAFFLLVLTTPIRSYAALCAKPDKSTTYFDGYDAAQSDFHGGRPQNQTVIGDNSPFSADYKQGYKDGWNDAQYNVNVLQNSIC